ncbi:hypothetical protein DUNSADRAFT_8300 [Dunaliella salina]|uniref:Uncharacterized protein n=1 Tax=Dunaliella salina TaxID=3046 RepID=A0ABQ7HAA6_DUNSA|nr:hypothetical protein DUNSADRAFT_8300 [Dunaliella salina]|eukprot:KAF5843784.1 hypothetical protein DUNSADRAFT_8300 [Dunaliella salina]
MHASLGLPTRVPLHPLRVWRPCPCIRAPPPSTRPVRVGKSSEGTSLREREDSLDQDLVAHAARLCSVKALRSNTGLKSYQAFLAKDEAHTHAVRRAIRELKEEIKSESAAANMDAAQRKRNCRLGTLWFNNKTCASLFVAKWLRTSYPGYIVEEEDLPWVMALFSQHPRFESKLHNWSGTVSCEFSHGNYHFALHKHGEGWEDISYKRCLSAKASKGIQDVFRTAVADQTSSFKRKVFRQSKVICPETGEQLSWSTCAIDHVAASGASFADLMRGFLAPKNLRGEEITTIKKPGTLFNDIADPVLKEEWRAYHAEHAILRPVSRRWNDAEGVRKRQK